MGTAAQRPQTFAKVEVDAPTAADLTAGQVLLASRAGGICGSDLPFFRGAPLPQAKDQGAWVPGFPLHELVGEVVATAHPAHEVGDLVVGATGFDGIAEFVVSDGEELSSYDRGLAPTTAVMLQPLACVLYVVHRLGDVRGKVVAVVGQGPIGLLFSHVLKRQGARHVTGVANGVRVEHLLRGRRAGRVRRGDRAQAWPVQDRHRHGVNQGLRSLTLTTERGTSRAA